MFDDPILRRQIELLSQEVVRLSGRTRLNATPPLRSQDLGDGGKLLSFDEGILPTPPTVVRIYTANVTAGGAFRGEISARDNPSKSWTRGLIYHCWIADLGNSLTLSPGARYPALMADPSAIRTGQEANGDFFVSLQAANNAGHPLSDSAWWQRFNPLYPTRPVGSTPEPLFGVWVPDATYGTGDACLWQGQTWGALRGTTGEEPGENSTAWAPWTLSSLTPPEWTAAYALGTPVEDAGVIYVVTDPSGASGEPPGPSWTAVMSGPDDFLAHHSYTNGAVVIDSNGSMWIWPGAQSTTTNPTAANGWVELNSDAATAWTDASYQTGNIVSRGGSDWLLVTGPDDGPPAAPNWLQLGTLNANGPVYNAGLTYSQWDYVQEEVRPTFFILGDDDPELCPCNSTTPITYPIVSVTGPIIDTGGGSGDCTAFALPANLCVNLAITYGAGGSSWGAFTGNYLPIQFPITSTFSGVISDTSANVWAGNATNGTSPTETELQGTFPPGSPYGSSSVQLNAYCSPGPPDGVKLVATVGFYWTLWAAYEYIPYFWNPGNAGLTPGSSLALPAVVLNSVPASGILYQQTFPLDTSGSTCTLTISTSGNCPQINQPLPGTGGGSTPTLNASLASLARNAPTLGFTGTNISTTAANDSIVLSGPTGSPAGTVASSPAPTSTMGTLTMTTAPTSNVVMYGVLTVSGIASGLPVPLATIVSAPTVTVTTTSIGSNATQFTITGTGFDLNPSGNTVVISNVTATGHVIAATATSLTVQFDTGPTGTGQLKVVVTSFGGSSGSATEVAVVGSGTAPVVNFNDGTMPASAATIVILGSHFNSTPANNTIVFNSGAAGTAGAGSTITALVVTFSANPSSAGPLTAVVTDTSTSLTSGAPVQVALIQTGPVITPSSVTVLQPLTTLTINGSSLAQPGDTTSVSVSSGTVNVISATPTAVVIAFTSRPAIGALTAVVTVSGVGSSAWAEIANVTAAASPTVDTNTANLAQTSPQISITGTNFSTTPEQNTVVFSGPASPAAGVVNYVNPSGTLLQIGFTTPPAHTGALNAVVTTTLGGSSGAGVQVATTVSSSGAPTITLSTAAYSSGTLVVNGTNFSTTPSANFLATDSGDGVVIASTATQLTFAFTTAPNLGPLLANVAVNGVGSGYPGGRQIATVATALPPSVNLNTGNIAYAATSFTIRGANFDSLAANNTVPLSGTSTPSGWTLQSCTPTSIVMHGGAFATNGTVKAIVTTTTGSSGAAVQVGAVTGGASVSASNSTVVASNSSPSTGTNITITATAKDGSSNPVAGKLLTLSVTGSSTGSGFTGTSNGSGVVTYTVTDSVGESVTYSVSDTTDSISITQTATVVWASAGTSWTQFSGNTVTTTTSPWTIAPPDTTFIWSTWQGGSVYGTNGNARNTLTIPFHYAIADGAVIIAVMRFSSSSNDGIAMALYVDSSTVYVFTLSGGTMTYTGTSISVPTLSTGNSYTYVVNNTSSGSISITCNGGGGSYSSSAHNTNTEIAVGLQDISSGPGVTVSSATIS